MPPVRSTGSSPKPAVASKPAAKTPKKRTASGPKPAAPAKPVWTGATSPTDAFKGVVAQVGTAIRSAAPGPYEMIPGRYPDAVSLPAVLSKLGSTPEGQAAVTNLLGALKAKTGITMPPEVQAALLSNPSGATTALELTPRQLSQGVLALNAAYQAGKIPPQKQAPDLLPQTFDLSGIDKLDAPRPQSSMKQVAPGLFQGDLVSATPDAQVKQNRVMAEVFTRLSTDVSQSDANKFSVTYNGQSYSRLDDFLGALKADGYDVKVSFQARIANFADLKTPVPGSNAGQQQWLDVPAPLMIKTGVKDPSGKEAIVPASHSEMIISLRSGANTQGPKLDSDLRFFQGDDGTGFVPDNLWQTPNWLGRVTHAEVTGDDAIKALNVAGSLGDVIDQTAKSLNLYADGYGVTGVCNDSVAIVQQAVLGHIEQYPLMMHEELLLGELKKRLAQPAGKDSAMYQTLSDAIAKVPSDIKPNASAKARALASLPWVDGKEPFQSTSDARKILSQ